MALNPLSKRKALGGATAGLSVVFLGAILIMANYLANRHYRRGDWTSRGVYTLSDKSIQILTSLKQDVELTVFMGNQISDDGERKETIYPEVKELLTRMRRYSTHVKVSFFDQERDPQRAEIMIKQYGVTSDDELRGGVIVVKTRDRHKFITADEMSEYGAGEARDRRLKAFKGEQAILSALMTLIDGDVAEICATADHDEGDLESIDERRGFSAFAAALKRDTHKTRKLKDLEKGVPASCSIVMVLGPRKPFSPEELGKLEGYLAGGGKLLAFVGPNFDAELKLARTGLEPLLLRWGARLGDNLVLDPQGRVRFDPSPFTWGTTSGFSEHPIGKKLRGRMVSFPLARSVSAAAGAQPGAGAASPSIDAQELVRTSAEGWGETSFGVLRGDADLRFDAATDLKGPVPVAVASQQVKDARLVVFGSSLMLANPRLEGGAVDDDVDMVLASVGWLLKSDRLLAVGPKTPEHVKLILSDDQMARTKWIVLLGLPLTGLLLGGAAWWMRRL